MEKNIYIIAGEASGDLHASNLVKSFKEKQPNVVFRGWGGDLMEAAGVKLVKHYKETAFMGFFTVLLHLRTIFKNIIFCKQDILNYRPDAIILVDYAGFNLRIAAFAKKHRIPVYYYIAPKVWAWKESRVKKIRESVTKLYCILPFEQEYFTAHGIDTFYAGNPLLDAVAERSFQNENFTSFQSSFDLDKRQIIAILPGSRKQEIKAMLPTMLSVVPDFPEYQFVLAGAPGISDDFYDKMIKESSVKIIRNETYRLLAQSRAAMVASGTATLETGLLKVPQVVCYNTSGGRVAYEFGKWLIRTKYISLVNLILDKEAVKELIIIYFKRKYLREELKLILTTKREHILKDYDKLATLMGKVGVSEHCATQMLRDMKLLSK